MSPNASQMLRLLSWDRDTIVLEQWDYPVEEVAPGLFNPLYQKFTNIRTVAIRRVFPIWWVKAVISTDKNLRIYSIMSHDLILTQTDRDRIASGMVSKSRIAERLRVKYHGQDYIDEFGLYVYAHPRLGYSTDIDLRYDRNPEPELFNLEYIEYDLLHRPVY